MSNLLPNSGFWSRRQLLQSAGAGFGAIAADWLLHRDGVLGSERLTARSPLATKPPHHAARAKSVIFIFAYGGPSQVDMFDHKPSLRRMQGKPIPVFRKEDAFNTSTQPTAFPSPYRFTRHGQSGLEMSELLPAMSTVADELCYVRSLHCESNNHAPALFQMNTGFILAGRPSFGSWVTYGLGSEADSLPAFVVMWDHRGGPIGGAQNWTSGFLPAAYQGTPFRSKGEPIIDLHPPRNVDEQQQRARLRLLRKLNERHLADNPSEAEFVGRMQSYELAYRMQMAAPEAVDVDAETEATQRLYGMDRPISAYFGRQCLMARRLVERGVRFVQLYSGGADQQLSWDAHSGIRENLEQHCPEVDRPLAGLIKDLKRRGLLDETLVIFGGEFGRMPTNQGNTGRDHNPRGFTMVLAGGGVKGGMTYGSTDEFGYAAEENPVSIPDLHATCLHLLGLDHELLTFHHRSRDMRLTDVSGRVLADVIA